MKTTRSTRYAIPLTFLISASSLFAQATWTGVGTSGTPALWSNAANWTVGTAPTNSATTGVLTFLNTSANSFSNNDLTNLTVGGINIPANDGATLPINVKDNTVTGNAFTLTGAVTVATGNFQNFANNITLAAGSGSFVQTSGQTTFSGVLSGSQAITKTGGSTVVFSGANSFTGNVLVSAGALSVTTNTALGTSAGKTTANGGRLDLSNNVTITGENLEIAGNAGSNTAGVVRNVSGTNTWAGNVTTIGNDSRLVAAAGTLTISGVISSTNIGNNQVIFRGEGGTFELTGANTYAGLTRVFGGATNALTVPMLRLSGGNNRLATTTTIDLGGGGVSGSIELAGISQEVAGLVSNNGATNSKISGTGAATLVVNNASAGSFTGTLTDSLAFTKKGAGLYTLANAGNTYSRGTLIEAGTLATGATGNFGFGDITVGSANLTLGNAASIADTASLFFGTSSTISLGFTGIETIGMLGNSVASTFIGTGTYNATQLNTFFGGSIFTGTGSFNVTATSAIPEPSTYAALAGLGVLILAAYRRRPAARA